MKSIYGIISDIENSSNKAALCIVTDTRGSSPRKAGSKMIVYGDRKIQGTVGGGSVELQVIDDAMEAMKLGQPVKKTYNLEHDLAMHCGGTMEVYIEPVANSLKLYIFGAGHIGRVVAKFAAELGFNITLFDNRPEIFNEFSTAGYELVKKDYFEAIDQAVFDENTYVVVVTHKHAHDEDIIARVAKKLHKYAGMIGSKRKVALAKKKFIEENILNNEELEKIDMPIGIECKAETPQEIAVSIVAKLVEVKNS